MSHIYEFIFLKTKKTAGTSLQSYLQPLCQAPGAPVEAATTDTSTAFGVIGGRGPSSETARLYNHAPPLLVKAVVGDAVWDRYLKVTAIRDPFDKVVSMFWFLNGLRMLDIPNGSFPRDSPASVIRAHFRDYVRTGDLPVDRYIYSLGGTPCCDIYLRYEQLLDDLKALCGKLGTPFEPKRLSRLKGHYRSKAMALEDYYDAETIGRVASEFSFELEYFGYPNSPKS